MATSVDSEAHFSSCCKLIGLEDNVLKELQKLKLNTIGRFAYAVGQPGVQLAEWTGSHGCPRLFRLPAQIAAGWYTCVCWNRASSSPAAMSLVFEKWKQTSAALATYEVAFSLF